MNWPEEEIEMDGGVGSFLDMTLLSSVEKCEGCIAYNSVVGVGFWENSYDEGLGNERFGESFED